jgi:hypothetical protein
MRIVTVIVALLALAPAAALAAEKTKTPPPLDTETIVVSRAVELLNALSFVAGYHDRVVGEKIVSVPFDLGATPDRGADVRWALTDDISALRKVVTTAQDIQKQLTQTAEAKAGVGPLQPRAAVTDAKGNVTEPARLSEAQVELNEQIQKLLDSERPVDRLFRIKREDLKVGVNQFPGPILSALEPILDR